MKSDVIAAEVAADEEKESRERNTFTKRKYRMKEQRDINLHLAISARAKRN